jgi:hypothetical protein
VCPSSIERDCDRRTTSTGGKASVNVHVLRLTLEPKDTPVRNQGPGSRHQPSGRDPWHARSLCTVRVSISRDMRNFLLFGADFTINRSEEAQRAAIEEIVRILRRDTAPPPDVVVRARLPLRQLGMAEPASPQGLVGVSAVPSLPNTAGMSHGLVLIIALMWLLAIGLPAADAKLPSAEHMVITNEFAAFAIVLAVAWRLIDKRRK